MQINDEAIMLSCQKYSENSAIVTVFTENHGIYKGLVRAKSSSKQRGIYQIGNILEVTWRARLAENLGNIEAQLLEPVAAKLMDKPFALSALVAFTALLEATLAERDKVRVIYHKFKLLINQLVTNEGENQKFISKWLQEYILLELALLKELGFGLELDSCAATGANDNLAYISPKSGRAVCKEAGLPYEDKLFSLPRFMNNETNDCELDLLDMNDIRQGLKISNYFFNKFFFHSHDIRQPYACARFYQMVYSGEMKL